MRFCIAQIRSTDGAVEANLERHLSFLRHLEPRRGDLVVFPELSLTNYSPELAEALALDDRRLEPLQAVADRTGSTILVGAPLRTSTKPQIVLVAFAPDAPRRALGKCLLHPDELAWFTPAAAEPSILDLDRRVGLAICFEISSAHHRDALVSAGAEVYVASAAKTAAGAAEARRTLAAFAARHGIPALFANSVGVCEGQPAGGGSAAFDPSGRCLARLDEEDEGVVIYDATASVAAVRRMAI